MCAGKRRKAKSRNYMNISAADTHHMRGMLPEIFKSSCREPLFLTGAFLMLCTQYKVFSCFCLDG
jgi:hypothetical protein